MSSRILLRCVTLLALLMVISTDVEAQRRGGKRGGKRGGGRPGGVFLPKPLPPIKIPKPATLPPSAKRPQTSLLPDADSPTSEDGVPSAGITIPKNRNVVFWTDPRDPELEDYYFHLSDHDGNSWISYREGSFSLRLSRLEFTYYDTDRDGRIQRAEFSERYGLIVDNQGIFAPPRSRIEDYFDAEGALGTLLGANPAPTDEMQILERFDANGSSALELGELPPVIQFWNLTAHITPVQLLEAIDTDVSSALELQEMSYLVESMAIAQQMFNGSVLSFQELAELSSSAGTTPLTDRPPLLTIERSKRPTVHFDRLDQDGDEFIGADDLRVLQSPMQLSVRTNAVIAAIDTDGDGQISLAEFAEAFE